ncbi:hypothetical protein SFRURICE_003015 [Spodoptera frugiperda]|nr:hypothetical protein SFRURICE_003015 [Spodoptera frugiperda]
MIFPTTNTCPNTLPYLYDGHSWTEYASYFVTMFSRRISIHGQFLLYKQGTSCKNQPALDSGHRACHVVGPPCQYNAWAPRYPTIALDKLSQYPLLATKKRNWPCIVILLRNIFEDNDEIRRIFSPRVTVIEIRKCVRACIRRREDHFEQNFAN